MKKSMRWRRSRVRKLSVSSLVTRSPIRMSVTRTSTPDDNEMRTAIVVQIINIIIWAIIAIIVIYIIFALLACLLGMGGSLVGHPLR